VDEDKEDDEEGGEAKKDVPPYLYYEDWPIKDIRYVIAVMVVRAVKYSLREIVLCKPRQRHRIIEIITKATVHNCYRH
jgi:hypothetical protein